MKRLLALLVVVPVLAACGSDADTTATGPGGGALPSPSVPGVIPAAPGTVSTQLVTVMDTGTPEVCLGPVAESYPPQCTGPELVGWDWSDHGRAFEHQGDIRWGQFALTGTWDGERFSVEGAVPAALYDAMPAPSPAVPSPVVKHTPGELEEIAEELAQLPGVQGSGEVHGHHVIANVIYDDGSLRRWADHEYGEHTVHLVSALTDQE